MALHHRPTLPRATRRVRAGASFGPTMLRPFTITGAIVLGAGLVVATPTGLGQLPGSATVRDVTLAAGESDLLTPWIDQFNTTSQNATTLMNTFFEAPGIGWQQFIANMSGYLQDFFNDPTSTTVTTVSQDMQAHLAAVLTGYGLQDASVKVQNVVEEHTLLDAGSLGESHRYIFGSLSEFLPSSINISQVQPILSFLGSPESGIMMGILGPEISPWVALLNSVDAGDSFNATLANMVGAYFNGSTLSLNDLIPLIDQADVFPAGISLENIDIAFGGLLTPGDTTAGVGGSIFNSLGLELIGAPVIGQVDLTGEAVGPLGALEGWAQALATLLGWSGSGSPLADVTLPTVPTDFLDSGTAAADLSSWMHDPLAAF